MSGGGFPFPDAPPKTNDEKKAVADNWRSPFYTVEQRGITYVLPTHHSINKDKEGFLGCMYCMRGGGYTLQGLYKHWSLNRCKNLAQYKEVCSVEGTEGTSESLDTVYWFNHVVTNHMQSMREAQMIQMKLHRPQQQDLLSSALQILRI